jgi:flavodoxin
MRRPKVKKALIVYESKYGNTRLVAEKIAEGMSQASEIEIELVELKDVNLDQVDEFDTILIGSPNHVGSPTRSIRKFIDELGKSNIKNKKGAVFDTYMAKDFEKAVKKMEKQIGAKVPGLILVAPGLSIRVDGMKGPVTDGELPKCEEFVVRITK